MCFFSLDDFVILTDHFFFTVKWWLLTHLYPFYIPLLAFIHLYHIYLVPAVISPNLYLFSEEIIYM